MHAETRPVPPGSVVFGGTVDSGRRVMVTVKCTKRLPVVVVDKTFFVSSAVFIKSRDRQAVVGGGVADAE